MNSLKSCIGNLQRSKSGCRRCDALHGRSVIAEGDWSCGLGRGPGQNFVIQVASHGGNDMLVPPWYTPIKSLSEMTLMP
jgi:hypothetical protein